MYPGFDSLQKPVLTAADASDELEELDGEEEEGEDLEEELDLDDDDDVSVADFDVVVSEADAANRYKYRSLLVYDNRAEGDPDPIAQLTVLEAVSLMIELGTGVQEWFKSHGIAQV